MVPMAQRRQQAMAQRGRRPCHFLLELPVQSLLRHKYVIRTWDLDIYDGLGIKEMEMEMTCRLLMTPRSIFGYADPPLSHFFAGDFVNRTPS